MATSRRGPKPGTETAKRGGQATRDLYGSDWYHQIGKKGGATASARIGPEGYRAIGHKGGSTTKARYGADYYRRIGQKGGKARRRNTQRGEDEQPGGPHERP